MKVAIVGGGNMGAALAQAFLRAGAVSAQDLLVIEKDRQSGEALKSKLHCSVLDKPEAALADYPVLLLAVKPQNLSDVAPLLQPFLNSKCLIISILAGTTLAKLRTAFPRHAALVRAMPNTPAQIGRGMTIYFPMSEVSTEQRKVVDSLFKAVGKVLQVADEALLDAATAVAGSGPAYVFYFIEHFIEAASELGFSAEEARQIVSQTMLGACELWEQSGESSKVLRERVTSKGGTTAAGLGLLNERKVGESLVEAVRAAQRRSVEIGKN